MSTAVDDLLDVEAAARHVGCSKRTIGYRMKTRGLEPVARLGGACFFTVEVLDEHFRDHPFEFGKGPRPRYF